MLEGRLAGRPREVGQPFVNQESLNPVFVDEKALVLQVFGGCIPFLGRQSGNGREWGSHGFTDFLEIKAVEGYGQ